MRYEWRLFEKTPTDQWKELSNIRDMLSSRDQFQQTLAVKARALTGGMTYKLRLESWDVRVGARGYSEYSKEVNKPPHMGSCKIVSKHGANSYLGYAFHKDFTIICSGWQDDTKLTYSVTAQVADDQPETPIPADAVLEVGKEYKSPPLSLPVGLEKNGFWVKVCVVIKDGDDASTTWPLKAQVGKIIFLTLERDNCDCLSEANKFKWEKTISFEVQKTSDRKSYYLRNEFLQRQLT